MSKSGYSEVIENTKCNVISWYPFKENSRVLNLSNKDWVQAYLSQKNVECDSVLDGKYDYILVIGNVREYYTKITEGVKYLNENGKLILAFDNCFSVRNMSLEMEHGDICRREIEEFLDKNNFSYRKTYYAFSNIDAVNVVYTDDYMVNFENISRNIYFYDDNDFVLKNENNFIEKLISKDAELLKYMSNAYIVESSRTKTENNGIRFVSFSNMRKAEYKIKTVIKDNFVYKTAQNEKAKSHILKVSDNIERLNKLGINAIGKYENGSIITEFKEAPTLNHVLVKLMLENKKMDAFNIISDYYEFIKSRLSMQLDGENVFDKYGIRYSEADIEGLSYTKYGFWDLIFQNCFFIDSEYIFYDQEWMEENIPIEYIMYRAYMYDINLREQINEEEYFSLLNITNNNVKLFNTLDSILQIKTRDDCVWNVHSNYESLASLRRNFENELRNKEQMKIEFDKLLNEKDAKINFLESSTCRMMQEGKEIENNLKNAEYENKILRDRLNYIENSRSWKIISSLKGMLKKKENNNEGKR